MIRIRPDFTTGWTAPSSKGTGSSAHWEICMVAPSIFPVQAPAASESEIDWGKDIQPLFVEH